MPQDVDRASKPEEPFQTQYFPQRKSIIIEPHCLSLSEGYHHVRENQTWTHLAQIQSLKDQKLRLKCVCRNQVCMTQTESPPHPTLSQQSPLVCLEKGPEWKWERETLDLGTATDGSTPRRRERVFQTAEQNSVQQGRAQDASVPSSH